MKSTPKRGERTKSPTFLNWDGLSNHRPAGSSPIMTVQSVNETTDNKWVNYRRLCLLTLCNNEICSLSGVTNHANGNGLWTPGFMQSL